jgi:hypothetical protein
MGDRMRARRPRALGAVLVSLGTGLVVALAAPAQAANWPMLLGTEEGRKETPIRPFGFLQLRLETTPFAEPVSGLRGEAFLPHEKEMAAFNVDEPFALQVRRARIGARGTIPGTDGRINYFLALEGGTNAATRDRGLVLLDGSVTVAAIPGARIRVGQFKLPVMDETLEANPVTADFINFSPLVDQLVFENQVRGGRLVGPGSANRDVGVQVFDSFLLGNLELSYAAMLSQGRMGGLDVDPHKDVTVRGQVSWLPALEQRWSPHREEISAWAWRLQGGRVVDGEDVLRVRQGVGGQLHLFHTRTRLEVVAAEGALFAGQSPPFPGEPFVVIPDGEAWGWAFDVAIGGPGSALGPFELSFGLEELHRLPDKDPRARVFRNAIVGAQWHFAEHAKLMANWEWRDIRAPSPDTPADARLTAASIADLLALQLVVTF